nr:EOG090X00WU [Triops cancriformis]
MVGSRPLALSWRRERVFDQEVAQAFYSSVQNCKQAKVTSVSKKEKQKQRPAALNTVELMRVASSNLNMSPHHAMQIAERLYTQGYISYPRTETTQYHDEFDFRGPIAEQQGNPEVRDHVQSLLQQGYKKPRGGQDVGDHPPITPLKAASRNELDADSWRIYDYVVRHFLATVSPDCVYLSTEVEFQVGNESFKISGKTIITPGFLPLINPNWGKQDDLVPDVKAQQLYPVEQIDPQLVLPTMRSEVEKQLNLIAKGKANYQDVLRHTLEIFRLKFLYFVKNIAQMDHLFEDTFSSLTDSGRNFSRCGKCRRYLKLVAARPARLHCAHCDETYALPQNGNFKLYNELKCPLDDFELIIWTTGSKGGKSYAFCPCCYNAPPFRDMDKATPCNACTHPTCPHGLSKNGVASCGECPKGTLYLDQTSFPKWKLACNKCEVTVNLAIDVHKIIVTEDSCEECDARILHLDLKPMNPTTMVPLLLLGCVSSLLSATPVNSMALYGVPEVEDLESSLNTLPPSSLSQPPKDFFTWWKLQHEVHASPLETDSTNSLSAEASPHAEDLAHFLVPVFQKRQSNRLCGPRLSAALHMICDGRYYGKRSSNYDQQEPTTEDAVAQVVHWNRLKRGVHEECCMQSCTLRQMRAYCAA